MKKLTLILFTLAFAFQAWSQDAPGYPAGKISGIIFGDYYYSLERDSNFAQLGNTAIDGAEGVHGLQIRRIYLTYNYNLNERFSTRVRLEADGANFTVSSSNKASKFGMFVKDAYIKWRVFNQTDLIVGIQGPPAFEVSESVWGNRFLEKTIMDQRKIVSSRDMGISLKGNLNSSGSLKYWLMYANNSATKQEADVYKRYYGHLQFSPVKNFTLTAYSDYQSRADITNTYDSTQVLSNNALTAALFAGYKVKDKYMLGVETYLSQVEHGFDDQSSLVNRPGYGISVFGSYTIDPRFELVARFDHFEPNSLDAATGDTRNWVLAGFKYMPAKNVVIAPNVLFETYESKGGINYKSSVTPRLTFSFKF